MQVRMKSEVFGTELCELQLQPEGLTVLQPNREPWVLPLSQIRHFQTEGHGTALKRFVLETPTRLHEGIFLEAGDADMLVRYLQQQSSCYVEIRLDAE